MQAKLRTHGDVAVVDLDGRLVGGDGDEVLREIVNRLLAENRLKILLNFSGVSAIDSTGIGELVESRKLAERFGASIKLLEAHDRVRHVLDASLLLPLFEHFEDEKTAMASFA
jgi:anti-anti-sigma factor